MATREDIYTAIKNADAAGDSASVQKLGAYLKTMDAGAAAAEQPKPESSSTYLDKLKANTGVLVHEAANTAAGLVRGAGSIGATLLYPIDKITDMVKGDRGPTVSSLVTGQQPLSRNAERRQAMDARLRELGADTNSTEYGVGKLAGEVAGTAGAGPALAVAGRALPVLARAPNLLNAIRTSGMQGGNLLTRAAGGALAGGATVGLVDPEHAVSGAAVGGVLPLVIKGAGGNLLTRAAAGALAGGATMGLVDPEHAVSGAAIGGALLPGIKVAGLAGAALARSAVGQATGNALRQVTQPRAVNAAEDLAAALSAASPEQRAAIIAQLRAAPTLVEGSGPTVAQALQSPEAGILQRVVHDSPGGGALQNKIAAQGKARTNALEGVANIDPTGPAMARENLGLAVSRATVPAREAEISRVRALYDGVDPEGAVRLQLPIDDLQGARDKFLGDGTFGQGKGAEEALAAAKQVGTETTPAVITKNRRLAETQGASEATTNPKAVDWQTLQNFRSSLGDAAAAAEAKGANRDAGALHAMHARLSGRIDEAGAAGLLKDGESFPLDAYARWTDANAAHAARLARFDQGPLAGIFRKGPNGEPALQGAEIASRAWAGGNAADVQSFKRLVGDNPQLLGQFKGMVATEGAGTVDAAGNLTTKFSKWVKQTLPGLREAFSPEEVSKLQSIAADIDRHAASVGAGKTLTGSDTYQKASNALSLGLLDPALDIAGRVPLVKYGTEAARNALKSAKANRLAELLSDSSEAANALEQLTQKAPRIGNQLAAQSLYRGAPRTFGRD